ncbi:hypothetical protein GOBAR_DD35197 [Gossypium barbadense]|nr:hypothetical protein GOBAR_DD35197 [Gossypium barbadense]
MESSSNKECTNSRAVSLLALRPKLGIPLRSQFTVVRSAAKMKLLLVGQRRMSAVERISYLASRGRP